MQGKAQTGGLGERTEGRGTRLEDWGRTGKGQGWTVLGDSVGGGRGRDHYETRVKFLGLE